MATFIDTLISVSLISGVMLVGVLASAIYERIQNDRAGN